ncbi:hypothetical protein COY23_01470 [bacterium (Candidatus Torokbacteria) CG_4_10_14_0_2_um_filter_35_8]|nr:MAG: hypothetical protein COY23_01470 [bacterium (Candidatus Torokbacteria) CG_4_10_14_0_2_um_filter_35_8]
MNEVSSQGIKPSSRGKMWTWILIGFVVIVTVIVLGIIGQWFFSSNWNNESDSYMARREVSTEAPLSTPGFGEGESKSTAEDEELESYSNDSATSKDFSEQKIIKTGSLDVEVEDVSDTVEKVKDLAGSKKGFIQDSKFYTSDGKNHATIIIRVPVKEFDNAINDIKKLAKVINEENISGKDVTEEYVDLQARLKSFTEEEKQYLAILKKAKTVEDILKVTKALTAVRTKIESIEGQIKYLENKTDLATITVYISEEVGEVMSGRWKPLVNAKKALKTFISLAQGLIDALIWLVIVMGPFVLLIWIVIKVIKVIKKRKV